MQKIQMVDLKSQYEKIKPEIDAGIQEVINNTQFIKGPQIKVFEDGLAHSLGVKHVISCANGTDALQIAMMALDLKPGDEVILPVFTYVATAEVIALLGLIPIMVDVHADTFCIDTKLIEVKISSKTKAIVPVHLFGQCAYMDEIMRIAKKHNLFVIEDTAQAIGSEYQFNTVSNRTGIEEFINTPTTQKAGTIGHIGTTSFFPSKNLGCYGDGGALMTNDDELANKIRIICNHGQRVQYVHDVIGVNSRLDSIQAAILNAKLPHLHEYEVARQKAASWYDELLGNHPNIIVPKRSTNSTHVFHQYTLQIVGINRDRLRSLLAENGIPSMVYYPIELHKQKAFEVYNKSGENFPVSAQLCQTVLSLPMHTELSKETVSFIASQVISSIDSLSV
jgi:dTDP-4-amino-4,6-dideoxygalactose transaminase